MVLLAGGNSFDTYGSPLASAELYDPGTGTFSATGSMTAARKYHSATLLPNGMVLVAGGNGGHLGTTFWANAELYDPASGIFASTGSMTVGKWAHTATLLQNGTVLVAGGFGYRSAELFSE